MTPTCSPRTFLAFFLLSIPCALAACEITTVSTPAPDPAEAASDDGAAPAPPEGDGSAEAVPDDGAEGEGDGGDALKKDGGPPVGDAAVPSDAAPPVDAAASPFSIPSAFDGYCRAVLLAERALEKADAPMGWVATAEKAPAGTTVLLAYGGGYPVTKYAGLVFDGAGTPYTTRQPGSLVSGVDFTTTCDLTKYPVTTMLVRSTFFATDALAGQACVFQPGEQAKGVGYGYVKPGVGQLSGPPVTARCGFSPGYTPDLMYGSLYLK